MKFTRQLLNSTALIMTLAMIFGCGNSSDQKPEQQSSASTEESDHGHPHHEKGHDHGAGPHDGTLADWGGGAYHVEFTVDHAKKEATVYVLGSDEKTPVPITSEKLLLTIKDPQFQTDLLPVPLDGESDGKSSRFVGTHDGLATVKEYEGTISAEVDGTPYAGNFKEEAHEHGGEDSEV